MFDVRVFSLLDVRCSRFLFWVVQAAVQSVASRLFIFSWVLGLVVLRLDSHRDCGTLPHDGTNQTAQTDNVMNGSTDSPTLAAPFPVNLELAVGLTRSELEQHLRLMAALKMFELGKISSGKAAQLAGMCRVDFFETCGRYRVSLFNYPPEEIEEELRRELQTLNDQEATTT